eukprot:Gb_28534 [translate_table: standard]
MNLKHKWAESNSRAGEETMARAYQIHFALLVILMVFNSLMCLSMTRPLLMDRNGAIEDENNTAVDFHSINEKEMYRRFLMIRMDYDYGGANTKHNPRGKGRGGRPIGSGL